MDRRRFPGALPDGDSAWVAKTAQAFPEWRGAAPADTFGRKKVLDYRGEPVFAELYVLRLLHAAGWSGVWANSYGKKQYLTSYDPRECAVLPSEQHALLAQIAERTQIIGSAALPIGRWDVFARRGDEVVFAECKRTKKDSIRTSQRMWLEAALALGVSVDVFLIVEWTRLQ